MRADQVFGISPEPRENSYIDRGNLDASISKFLGRTTHLAVRGPSKCGKSWLRQKALSDAITVQCRLRKPFTDIYVDALSQLNISIQVRENKQGVFKASLGAKGEAGAALLVKAGITASLGNERATETQSKAVGHDIDDLRFVAEIIKKSNKRLVIEDFHYMSTEDRRNFAYDLKALWDYGVFVIIIGVWSETNLLLHLNPDLSGRVHEISIDWTQDDLRKILVKGGEALKVHFSDEIQNHLAGLAYSNAGILQQLALLTLDEATFKERGLFTFNVTDRGLVDNASMVYAEQLNPLYQQFAKNVSAGIRSRPNATGIYAHSMAVIMDADDDELIRGLHARRIFERAVKRQSRIQYSNLKAILEKIESLQIDQDGRGLVLGYSSANEELTVVDRQLLLYRQFATVKWPWEDLIAEADKQGGQLELA
jgi:hypothetical protein